MKESAVRLHAPMPESSPEHPEACDWISYLRFRHVDGPRRSSTGGRRAHADAGHLRRRRLVRPGRAPHGPARREARAPRRGLGHRPALELPRGPPRRPRRGEDGRPARVVRLLLRGPRGGRAHVPRLRGRAAGRVPARRRPQADDRGLAHGHHARDAVAAQAPAQADLRRPLARRPADGGARELGLRRRPGDRRGRGLQPVRRVRRARHDGVDGGRRGQAGPASRSSRARHPRAARRRS